MLPIEGSYNFSGVIILDGFNNVRVKLLVLFIVLIVLIVLILYVV